MQERWTEVLKLKVLKAARNLLADHYIPWYQHKDSGYCAVGAIIHTCGTLHWDAIVDLTNHAATELHPELAGAKLRRLDNGTHMFDNFDIIPTVFVNNHLGKDAVLEVFDKAIGTLEAKLAPPVEEPVVIKLKTRELVAA